MIALLAMLTALVNRGTRTGQGMIGTEQARLAATEIMAYANNVANTVRQLRINGCSDTQISFESAATGTQYDNTSAPADNSCDVFHPNGGGMRHITFPENYSKGTAGLAAIFKNIYFISGYDCLSNVGTGGDAATCWNNGTNDDTELIIAAVDIKDEICLEINKRAGIDFVPQHPSWNGNFLSRAQPQFKGVYGSGGSSGHLNLFRPTPWTAYYTAHPYLCFFNQSPAVNVFYQVLIGR